MNAVVASGVPAADFAGGFDTAWIDFTKGLGAPVGAVLAASRELIDEAWRYKQMMGGAMRQAGILAAAGAVRARPQRRAPGRRPRQRAACSPRASRSCRASTSTRRASRPTSSSSACPTRSACAARSTKRASSSRRSAPQRLRAVTHLDVDGDDIDRALTVFRRLLRRLNARGARAAPRRTGQAGEADLERALRDVVGDHRAGHHAERRQHADHERVADAHVAVAAGATRRRARPARSRAATSPPPRAGTGPGRSRAPGTNRMPPPTPMRPATAPARKPSTMAASSLTDQQLDRDGHEHAGEQQRHRLPGQALLERGAGDHSRRPPGTPTRRPLPRSTLPYVPCAIAANSAISTIAASDVPVASCSE